MTYSVTLPANPEFEIGYVWEDTQGLWRVQMNKDDDLLRRGIHLEDYTAGPFGTRYDAELECHSVWERAVDMRWQPRRW